MKFNLKKPCKDCPFRSDRQLNHGWLGKRRAEEIAESLEDNAFPCHKTITYDDEDQAVYSDKTQHCYGALVVLNNEDYFLNNKITRMALMFGFMNPDTEYKSDLIVSDRTQFIQMHSE